MSIINGTFDTDLSGWTPSGNGNYDVIWDAGRARLRVYRCSNAYLQQTFVVDSNTLSFSYQTVADNWMEGPSWSLKIGTTTIYEEGFPVNRAGSYTGSVTKDIGTYIGQIATIEFKVIQSAIYCNNGDHQNTYLYVDNVQLINGSDITATSMTITPSETPCRTGICTVTVNVTWYNGGAISRSLYPAITVNGVRTPLAIPEVAVSIGPGLSSTISFALSGLTPDTYNICPNPN